MTVIDVRGLHMRYGTRDVLKGVDFHIDRGEVITLLGPNGAGKTTTIEILEGLRMRSAGEVSVLGVDSARGDERWRAQIGVVLQSWRGHGRWRVRELLAHPRQLLRPVLDPGRPRPQDVDELLETVGLAEQAEQRLVSLSGGQRRRLDVAVGLVGRPELLFLDEPTAGFDRRARRDFHDLVHRLSDLEDTTILLTTHDLAEAEQLADRILILAEGRIVADGSADQLARQVAGQAEVRWSRGLEVRRASLEGTYMSMVHRRAMSETIHNRIAMLRAERGISRRQLADALGVHYQTIGYLERGEYSPSLHLALRIAEHFEVPVKAIFSITPFPRLGTERYA